MNKTLGYWLEILATYGLGIAAFAFSILFWENLKFLDDATFLDKVISISSTLFGFLLAVLALIIQSNSSTIEGMKQHGSFVRLIRLNKMTVTLAIITSFYSLILLLGLEIIREKSCEVLIFMTSVNLGLFTMVLANTLLFTLVFYRIIMSDYQ
ncbi:hypothetical protein JRG66_05580 [Salinimicrobium tongyeongense]|uniref:Uncharacterized protein n=1 Tax=Salinimicrobium tongyeongense TaxID=2809707 RepID=A0ABY6NTX2_9FLAO|nr:hypothetical protein [Salinimicrobium tongyeongense]UZH56335.1 hypothetical protein JRG66_05580 [Salinimicrobium tongyeongense]